ncbi:MAG: subtilisin family serine protease [Thalassolituus sp.]|jgi:subtilisin family serine protease
MKKIMIQVRDFFYVNEFSVFVRKLFYFLCLLWVNNAFACDIPFQNFNKTDCLTPVANISNGANQGSDVYQVSGKSLQVSLSNRLIVRASGFTKPSLQALDSRIVAVSELYLMPEANYYLVTLNTRDQLSAVMKVFKDISNISLVQPDILQLTVRTEVGRTETRDQAPAQNTAPYFSQLDIPTLWQTTKGHGVKVAVIDDGFELSHEELRFTDVVFSYDAERRVQDVSPKSELDIHGTKVVGTIFAAHDGRGIDGIAPDASLIAIRQPTTWTSSTLLSFYLSKLSDADIVNASWNSQWLLEPLADIVTDLARNGRGGKGTAVVFSAGNNGAEQTSIQGIDSNEASLLDAVVIGSDDGIGHRTRFSNYGSSVDAYIYGKPAPALVSGGYGRFSGTSLSTAVASGYFALLLSNNPSLTLDQLVAQLSAQLHIAKLRSSEVRKER